MDLIVTSFLIASSKPRELSQFYALVCNGKVCKGVNDNHYLIMYRQNYKIQIYKPSTTVNRTVLGSSAFSVCFQKEADFEPLLKLKEWCKEIVLLGAEISEEPKTDFFGAEAWISDPEGNIFLLLVPLLKSKDQ